MALVFSVPSPHYPPRRSQVVLIVDDEPALGELFADVVRAEGFTPIVARSGREASKKLAQLGTNVVLILLDLFMPDMDGYEFRARQLDAPTVADIPTVMITGEPLGEPELSRLRPHAWLAKPMRLDQLRRAIAKHARGARSLAAAALDRELVTFPDLAPQSA
jgi:CheY-like chemotaxis protein